MCNLINTYIHTYIHIYIHTYIDYTLHYYIHTVYRVLGTTYVYSMKQEALL